MKEIRIELKKKHIGKGTLIIPQCPECNELLIKRKVVYNTYDQCPKCKQFYTVIYTIRPSFFERIKKKLRK